MVNSKRTKEPEAVVILQEIIINCDTPHHVKIRVKPSRPNLLWHLFLQTALVVHPVLFFNVPLCG
ncbi:hypothetical protein ACTXT7_005086 [Hymenolepis weldensis]